MSRTMTIRRVRTGEAAQVADLLTRAFADDPACNWVWNDPALAPEVSRAFFGVFAAFVLDAGEVYIDDGDRGVALWLPFDPAEVRPNDELSAALAQACAPFADRLQTLDELMVAAHPHRAAHAYLPFIGVIPSGQGTGVGSSLLQARLEDLDKAGLPAYLESTTPESARLYARHGFRHEPKTIDLPDGPSMFPMWREPAP